MLAARIILSFMLTACLIAPASAQQDSSTSSQDPQMHDSIRVLDGEYRKAVSPVTKATTSRDSSQDPVARSTTAPAIIHTAYPRGVTPPMTFAPYDVNSLGLSLIQAASGNWIQGDQNHFIALVNAKSIGDIETGKWNIKRTFTLDLGARYARDSSEFFPVRVSDNQLFLEAVVSYKAGWSINPYASSNLRTAVTESFSYYGLNRQRTAAFWDPVITQHSLGFSYVNYSGFDYYSVRAGVGFYSTRALHHTLLSDNWYTPERERYKFESGIETVSEANLSLDSSIFFTGRLELFGTFNDLSIWTLNSRNQFRFKVWRFINAILALDVVHNILQTRRTQWRQSFMLGMVKDF